MILIQLNLGWVWMILLGRLIGRFLRISLLSLNGSWRVENCVFYNKTLIIFLFPKKTKVKKNDRNQHPRSSMPMTTALVITIMVMARAVLFLVPAISVFRRASALFMLGIAFGVWHDYCFSQFIFLYLAQWQTICAITVLLTLAEEISRKSDFWLTIIVLSWM